MKRSFLALLSVLVVSLCASHSAFAKQRIYLLAGQSNMMGFGKTYHLPATFKQTPNNVTFYYQGRPRKLARYSHFGPEVSFAHHVARAFPQDEHIIVKFAATGSHIQQWMPGQPLYQGMLRQLGFSIKEKNPNIEAIVWMQGESDAISQARASQYSNHLRRFVVNLRKDLKSPHSLFIMGEINPVGKGFPLVKSIQNSQRQIRSQVRNVILTPAEGLGKIFDHTHYSAQGQMELGKRFANAYIQRIKK
ncbi:sialate O-acetylesterase [Leucothrix sargassi]|nr:sialate O-acetylesterase [Leucothrix sargassi]